MSSTTSFQDNDQTPKRVCLGKINGAHGVKGLVKVFCFGEDPKALEQYGPLYTSETGPDQISIKLKNIVGKNWLVEIEGIDDKTKADALNGTELWLERDKLPEPAEGEFYIEDLAGLKAEDKDGKVIGTVTSIQNFGAGDLLEIKPKDNQSFFLIFTKENVPNIDIETGMITINLPPEIKEEMQ
ncbi:MAG: ribosome maturation factor RimM [Micavibrio sp.]|nr:MAG: ribosome maturation factor RimM [Micavibrio sp.]